jgi:hypothetical protein
LENLLGRVASQLEADKFFGHQNGSGIRVTVTVTTKKPLTETDENELASRGWWDWYLSSRPALHPWSHISAVDHDFGTVTGSKVSSARSVETAPNQD